MPFYLKPRGFVPLAFAAEKRSVKNGVHHSIFTSRFDTYIGDWKRDLKEGKGLFLTINGKLYEGDWYRGFRVVADLPSQMRNIPIDLDSIEDADMELILNLDRGHGFGTLSNRLQNGTYSLEYRGDWVRGKPEGVGWRYFENGDVYFGFWKAGRRHGYGKMWYADGTLYVGYWKMNIKEGLGMFVQENGNRYEGNWENNIKNGLGRFYHMHTGQLQEGCWIDNVCVASKMSDIIIRQFCELPTEYSIPKVELENPRKVLEESEFWLKQKLGDIDKNLRFCIDQMVD